MTATWRHGASAALAGTLLLGVPLVGSAVPVVTSASGSNAAAIQAAVDSFRAALGNPNNGNAPGPLTSGRREINWDGGGATTGAAAGTPFNGFQNTRGDLLTTPGTGFLQTPVNDPLLTGINPTYATIFQAFSPVRIFTPTGSNITDDVFSIPGAPGSAAFVTGFGVVFSDVDLPNATTLQFFNVDGVSLGTFAAPTFNNGLSFLGVIFNAGEQVGRVRITTGTSALGPNDGGVDGQVDVVVMDDFLHSEPLAAIPEPSTIVLLGAGIVGVGAMVRRRRAQQASRAA